MRMKSAFLITALAATVGCSTAPLIKTINPAQPNSPVSQEIVTVKKTEMTTTLRFPAYQKDLFKTQAVTPTYDGKKAQAVYLTCAEIDTLTGKVKKAPVTYVVVRNPWHDSGLQQSSTTVSFKGITLNADSTAKVLVSLWVSDNLPTGFNGLVDNGWASNNAKECVLDPTTMKAPTNADSLMDDGLLLFSKANIVQAAPTETFRGYDGKLVDLTSATPVSVTLTPTNRLPAIQGVFEAASNPSGLDNPAGTAMKVGGDNIESTDVIVHDVVDGGGQVGVIDEGDFVYALSGVSGAQEANFTPKYAVNGKKFFLSRGTKENAVATLSSATDIQPGSIDINRTEVVKSDDTPAGFDTTALKFVFFDQFNNKVNEYNLSSLPVSLGVTVTPSAVTTVRSLRLGAPESDNLATFVTADGADKGKFLTAKNGAFHSGNRINTTNFEDANKLISDGSHATLEPFALSDLVRKNEDYTLSLDTTPTPDLYLLKDKDGQEVARLESTLVAGQTAVLRNTTTKAAYMSVKIKTVADDVSAKFQVVNGRTKEFDADKVDLTFTKGGVSVVRTIVGKY